MCCGRDKAMKLLAELDSGKGIGLIEHIKQGQGRPTKLYVKRFTTRTAPPKPTTPTPRDFLPNSDVDFSDVQRSEKSTLIILRKIILTLAILIHPFPLKAPPALLWG